ncbi:hypothetical protein CDD83_8000 [Cordyceps sp. RAO-2017]|nr:hypothetical protein CDD83_8000 [Cordyceps sp. RAO-2017]
MKRQVHPLAPARSNRRLDGRRSPPPPPPHIPKVKSVSVACELCRKRKIRCDGGRPACEPCRRKRNVCVYPSDGSAAADAVAGLKDQVHVLQRENARLRDLFGLLRSLPSREAGEILGQMRTADDATWAWRLARDLSSSIRSAHGPDVVPADADPRKRAIDLRALANSWLKVPARPWTIVVSDGLVSDLISSFFRWDDAFFFPFIDQDAFLRDMRGGDVDGATYCSPLLVNAICASRFFTSRAAKAYGRVSGEDLGAAFLNEAKKLWSLEGDRASLPAVQALAIMFTVSAYRGTDRQGLVYRYAAYRMLRQLDLPGAMGQADARNESTEKTRERAILSKALWGLFCFESIVGYVYLQQSLIPPPTIPRCTGPAAFDPRSEGGHEGVDDAPRGQPHVPGVFDAMCDLSELLYVVMQWNKDSVEVGSVEDVDKRRQFYTHIQTWMRNLPKHLRERENFTPQTVFLRIYANEVIISIFRSLHRATVIDLNSGIEAGEVLVQCAITDVTLSRRYIQQFTLAEYSCMALCGLYNAVLILVESLGDVRKHGTFVDACRMMRLTACDFPMARFILQGILAIAWSLNVAVPARAFPYLQSLDGGKEELRDIPMAFALPQADTIRSLLAEDGEEAGSLVEMGALLSKWSTLSIE